MTIDSTKTAKRCVLYTDFYARRGVIVYIVLFAILVLSILTAQFHRMAVQGQANTFRFEKLGN